MIKFNRGRAVALMAVSLLSASVLLAQEANTQVNPEKDMTVVDKLLSRIDVRGYGTINYHNYLQYDSDPYMKDKIDMERFVLYFDYKFTDRIKLSSEFEYEHGGTGVTMEFDALEEAGEFEMEVEQGGEAKLERLFIDFAIHPAANLRVGRFKLHMGLASSLDRPNKYFTVLRPEAESEMIPLGWYETGLQLYGSFLNKKITYEASISSGLDASGFSSRNWVKHGYQTRFEQPIAEAPAFSGRVDYHFGKQLKSFVGISGLVNNTTPNRPKRDLENTDGWVKIIGGYVNVDEGPVRFNASCLWGDLQNSDAIALKNRNLANSLNVKRTPVAKQALGVSAEIGYDLMHFIRSEKHRDMHVYPFFRYDYYDTMHAVAGNVTKNSMWKRSVYTGGVNWMINKYIVVKAEYRDRTLHRNYIVRDTNEDTGRYMKERELNLGIGYSF